MFAAVLATAALQGCDGKLNKYDFRRQLEAQLKDPGSAEYRNEHLYPRKTDEDLSLCGEVNSKNSFGGYVGFRRFMVSGKLVLVEDLPAGPTFETLWDKVCAD